MMRLIRKAILIFCSVFMILFCKPNKNVDTLEVENTEQIEKDSIDPLTGMVVDDRYNLIRANCLNCHSSYIITQNRADREGWEKMIRWMQEKQGLWSLEPNEEKILDYLSEHYGIQENVSGRRPQLDLTEIEWYHLDVKN